MIMIFFYYYYSMEEQDFLPPSLISGKQDQYIYVSAENLQNMHADLKDISSSFYLVL